MKGGHKVRFNAWNRYIDITNIPSWTNRENYWDNRTTIRGEGYEGDCSSNAFLLLGVMNRENAIYLAQHTEGEGLSWEHATDLLNDAFPGVRHYWTKANTSGQILATLADGEATIGAYEGTDFAHYFVVFNQGGTIYVVDSYFHISASYDVYRQWYGNHGPIYIIDSSETSPSSAQRITREMIDRIVTWDDDDPLPLKLKAVSEKQLAALGRPADAPGAAYNPGAAYDPGGATPMVMLDERPRRCAVGDPGFGTPQCGQSMLGGPGSHSMFDPGSHSMFGPGSHSMFGPGSHSMLGPGGSHGFFGGPGPAQEDVKVMDFGRERPPDLHWAHSVSPFAKSEPIKLEVGQTVEFLNPKNQTEKEKNVGDILSIDPVMRTAQVKWYSGTLNAPAKVTTELLHNLNPIAGLGGSKTNRKTKRKTRRKSRNVHTTKNHFMI